MQRDGRKEGGGRRRKGGRNREEGGRRKEGGKKEGPSCGPWGPEGFLGSSRAVPGWSRVVLGGSRGAPWGPPGAVWEFLGSPQGVLGCLWGFGGACGAKTDDSWDLFLGLLASMLTVEKRIAPGGPRREVTRVRGGILGLGGCPTSCVHLTNPKDLGPEDPYPKGSLRKEGKEDPYPKGSLRKEGKREDGRLDLSLLLVDPEGPADIYIISNALLLRRASHPIKPLRSI